jgi:hypothetical protein
MSRIIYVVYSQGGGSGGQKMTLRHVETLRSLGFDAICRVGHATHSPAWFEHKVPISVAGPIEPDDVLVIPADAPNTLKAVSGLPNPCFVLVQDTVGFSAQTLPLIEAFPADRRPGFLAVAPNLVASIQRAYPKALVELIPCFADERVFRPSATRHRAVAYTPRKRPLEAAAIGNLFRHLYPGRAALGWVELLNVTEVAVAEAFGQATLHLSLSRMESLGITPLEAMAAGCVCAGFPGVGGLQFATADNGFWVPDDDCEAAVEALVRADDLVLSGGAALAHVREASQATARQWSHAAFRPVLEEVWMRLAPQTRISSGPLD